MSGVGIQLQGVCYRYPSGEAALHDITVGIAAGEKIGLVGGNGAGKTTLLLQLNGCLLPSSGSIRIGGTVVEQRNLKAVRNLVGMVFKDPDDQLFMPTVVEDVAFGPLHQGVSRATVAERVEQALCAVDALPLQHRSPLRLSSGEKRRVALATVLAMEPSILVLDEPTDSLDPRSRRQLIDLLRQLDHTRLIASHDLDFLAATCDRLLVLHAGTLMADLSPAALFRNTDLLERCHLEPPLAYQTCPVCLVSKPVETM